MATVNVRPMPEGYHKISMRLRPGIPPIFPDGLPTPADLELAKDLFRALDDESKAWYRRNSSLFSDL